MTHSFHVQFLTLQQALYSEGEKADCLYIVLNGRLRSVKNATDGSQRKEMVCEFGRSECVGLVDCYGSKVRTTSIHAVRDTEVARIPAALMHHIKRLYPTTVQNIISLMTDQVMRLKGGLHIFCLAEFLLTNDLIFFVLLPRSQVQGRYAESKYFHPAAGKFARGVDCELRWHFEPLSEHFYSGDFDLGRRSDT